VLPCVATVRVRSGDDGGRCPADARGEAPAQIARQRSAVLNKFIYGNEVVPMLVVLCASVWMMQQAYIKQAQPAMLAAALLVLMAFADVRATTNSRELIVLGCQSMYIQALGLPGTIPPGISWPGGCCRQPTTRSHGCSRAGGSNAVGTMSCTFVHRCLWMSHVIGVSPV
jgi:hypothetical protein